MTVERDREIQDLLDEAWAIPMPNGAAPDEEHVIGREVRFPDAFHMDFETEDWLIPGFLARGRAHAVFTDPGQRKSLFALWACVEAIKLGHVVIYLDYEMVEQDLIDRLDSMGVDEESDLSRFHYYIMSGDQLAPLDSEAGGRDLTAYVDQIRADAPAGTEVLMVIDTFGRAVTGEENSNDTAMGFDRFTGRPLTQRGVTWLRLDHSGHSEKEHARGGSAKRGDVGVDWKMSYSEEDGMVTLSAKKRRYSWIPGTTYFDMFKDPLRWEFRRDWQTSLEAKRLADQMDKLGIPIDYGGRKMRSLLRTAGIRVGNDTIAQAIRWRKFKAHDAPEITTLNVSGDTFQIGAVSGVADTSPDTLGKPHNQASGHVADTSGHVVRDMGDGGSTVRSTGHTTSRPEIDEQIDQWRDL